MNKGFVIMACDFKTTTYLKCAEQLQKSIQRSMPNANVAIIKLDDLPYGDQSRSSDWKLANDWQVYESSPFEYTIKLEADMIIPRSIDYWWDVLKDRDLVVSTHIRNYKQEISDVRAYRRFIDDNDLPDCYNGITYFKKSNLAQKFFQTVRMIFENWNDFKSLLKCNPDEEATTDFVYALACHILGVENTTLPTFKDMSMIHMKKMINNLLVEDWTQALVYEILPEMIRIGTIPQTYPFHYHIKDFANSLEEIYG